MSNSVSPSSSATPASPPMPPEDDTLAVIHPSNVSSLANVQPHILSRSTSLISLPSASGKKLQRRRPLTPEVGQAPTITQDLFVRTLPPTSSKLQGALLQPAGSVVVSLSDGSAVVQRTPSGKLVATQPFSPRLPSTDENKEEEIFEV